MSVVLQECEVFKVGICLRLTCPDIDLVLFEVTQGFGNHRSAALLFRVSGPQSDDALGLVHEMLNLPLLIS